MDMHGYAGRPKELAKNAKNPENFSCFPNYLEEFERQGEWLVTQV
jgi:hypothetical protein